MRNNLIVFIITIVISMGALFFLPWWTIAIIAFIASTIWPTTKYLQFFIPFLAIVLLYTSISVYKNVQNDEILSSIVAEMFNLPNSWLTIVVGSLMYGIIAGLAGYSGTLLRKIFSPMS